MSTPVVELLSMEVISDPINRITEDHGVLGRVFSEGFTLTSEPTIRGSFQENKLPKSGTQQIQNVKLPNGGEKWI